MKTSVSRAKISACTKAKNSSSGMKIILAKVGRMKEKKGSTELPAKVLTKRRKENERISDSSEMISISPTKNSIGPWKPCVNRALKLKYLLRFAFHPNAWKAKTCVVITETSAIANVRLRSLVPGRTQGATLLE